MHAVLQGMFSKPSLHRLNPKTITHYGWNHYRTRGGQQKVGLVEVRVWVAPEAEGERRNLLRPFLISMDVTCHLGRPRGHILYQHGHVAFKYDCNMSWM